MISSGKTLTLTKLSSVLHLLVLGALGHCIKKRENVLYDIPTQLCFKLPRNICNGMFSEKYDMICCWDPFMHPHNSAGLHLGITETRSKTQPPSEVSQFSCKCQISHLRARCVPRQLSVLGCEECM